MHNSDDHPNTPADMRLLFLMTVGALGGMTIAEWIRIPGLFPGYLLFAGTLVGTLAGALAHEGISRKWPRRVSRTDSSADRGSS
ncbi:MAG: hypothetical protein AB7O26_10675 [Planctomycetaceae bacterium]